MCKLNGWIMASAAVNRTIHWILNSIGFGCSHQVNLTNRFHVAVRLFTNRLQKTLKCGKNKKVAHEAIAECITDVLTTF